MTSKPSFARASLGLSCLSTLSTPVANPQAKEWWATLRTLSLRMGYMVSKVWMNAVLVFFMEPRGAFIPIDLFGSLSGLNFCRTTKSLGFAGKPPVRTRYCLLNAAMVRFLLNLMRRESWRCPCAKNLCRLCVVLHWLVIFNRIGGFYELYRALA